jgi:pSer/pThr/pTyr-binding forkhead associated (FHA) protein
VDRVSGEFELVDDDSSNGTYVDGERLPPRAPRPVFSGQRVAFGKAMFVLVDRATLLQLARV